MDSFNNHEQLNENNHNFSENSNNTTESDVNIFISNDSYATNMNSNNTNNKNKRKANKNGKSFVRLIVCLIISIFTFLVLTAVQSYVLKNKITDKIVIAKQDIAINTEITKDNISTYFEIIERDSLQVTKHSFKSLEDIPEGILNDNIYKGEEILSKDIITKEKCLEYVGDAEIVEMSLKLSDIGNIVGGTVRAGDLINISCVNKVLDEAELLYAKVYVKQAFDSAGSEIKRDSDVSATTIVILATSEMEKNIYSKMCNGDLKISRYSLLDNK